MWRVSEAEMSDSKDTVLGSVRTRESPCAASSCCPAAGIPWRQPCPPPPVRPCAPPCAPQVRAGYRMALADDGSGFFLALPPALHAVCPLADTGAAGLEATAASGGGSKLSDGALAGIVVASVVAALCALAAAMVAVKHRRLTREYETLVAGPGRAVAAKV